MRGTSQPVVRDRGDRPDVPQRVSAPGIGFVPLDNAFAAVDDVAAVQAICDGLDEGTITALAARLLAVLPHPFNEIGRAHV